MNKLGSNSSVAMTPSNIAISRLSDNWDLKIADDGSCVLNRTPAFEALGDACNFKFGLVELSHVRSDDRKFSLLIRGGRNIDGIFSKVLCSWPSEASLSTVLNVLNKIWEPSCTLFLYWCFLSFMWHSESNTASPVFFWSMLLS